jgi:hypothetical protein
MNQFEPVPNQSLVQCEPVQAVQFTNLNQFEPHHELPVRTGSSSNH